MVGRKRIEFFRDQSDFFGRLDHLSRFSLSLGHDCRPLSADRVDVFLSQWDGWGLHVVDAESDRVWRVDAELCFFLFVLSPDVHSHQRVELSVSDPAQGTIRGGSCLGLGRVDSSLPGGLCLVVVSSECFPSIRSQGGDGVLSFDGLLHAPAPSKGKPVTTRSLTSFHGLLDGIENLVPTNRLSGAAGGLFSGLGIVFLCRLLRPPYLRTSGIDQAWIGPIQCIGVILEIMLFPFLRNYLRRWGFATTLLVGCVCLFARHLVYYVSNNPWMLSLSYLLAGMVIVFFHIVASILVNMMAGKEVRATAQTLLVVFGSGVGPMLSNYLAGVLTQQAGNSLRPVFGLGMLLAFGACLLIVSRYRSLARYHVQNPGHSTRPA